MRVDIAFADLTHSSQGFHSIAFPIGASFVASYSKKKLEDKADLNIFKYPDDFRKYLKNKTPLFACFSNFSWNLDISHEFAKKIKKRNPETISVFGGPNYPLEREEQKKFLEYYNAIDFYIRGEGEKAFVDLFRALEKFGFSSEDFKKKNEKSGNCYYVYNGKIIKGKEMPRLNELDEIPSPYLSGLLDKFFDGILTPVIQTTRGCPFECTYCQEGNAYYDTIARFSIERTKKELEYIAERIEVPNLILTDPNFGMYKRDIETCRNIAEIKRKSNWPKYIENNLGKNKKVVVEAVSALEGGILLSAPVQSTDPVVLENIKRKNISMEKIIEITKSNETFDANSLSEVILCLPGDTKQAHLKSMSDMINLGINVVRAHQLLMLPGSEISTRESREKYGLETRFRLQPLCFGNYEIYDKIFPSCEIDELCVANKTMSFRDYLDCRNFDLSVELFYNNGVFREPLNLLEQRGINASEFVRRVHEKTEKSPIKELHNQFLEENKSSLWKNRKELEDLMKNPKIIEEYIEKGLRNNEQLKYRALALFTRMEELHKIAYDSIEEILAEKDSLKEKDKDYLKQLSEFSLLRKNNVLSLDFTGKKEFNYDFLKLKEEKFKEKPFYNSNKICFEFYHTEEQREMIGKYLKQLGSSISGLGSILSRSHANKFYREFRKV